MSLLVLNLRLDYGTDLYLSLVNLHDFLCFYVLSKWQVAVRLLRFRVKNLMRSK